MSLFGPSKWDDDGWFARHSLSLVLGALLLAQTAWGIRDGAQVFEVEQPFGPGVEVWTWEFWTWWRWHYNISLVADTFGVLLIVLLSKWLTEEGSAEVESAPADSRR